MSQGDPQGEPTKSGSESIYGKRKMEDKTEEGAGGSDESREDDILIISGLRGEKEVNKRQKRDAEEDLRAKIGELNAVIRKVRFTAETVKKYCVKNKCISTNIVENAGTVTSGLGKAVELLIETEKLLEGRQGVKSVEKGNKETQVTPSLRGRESRSEYANKYTQSSPVPAERNIGKNKEGNVGKASGQVQGEEQGEEWTLINRVDKKTQARKDKEERKRIEEEEKIRRLDKEKSERAARKRRNPPTPRPEAIIVKASEKKTFADLFRELKANAGDKIGGIQTVRKSRGGDLLIELQKDTNCSEFEKVVKESLGTTQPIRRLAPRVTYEIKDIDPTLEKEEIIEEIAKKLQVDVEEVVIKNMRFGYGGTRTAIVSFTKALEDRLIEGNRVRIGFTSCRIKVAANVIRCFKCHEFGHMTYTCPSKQTSNQLCRKCGTEGHVINDCQNARRCILCTRQGVSPNEAEHVAGALNCPQYKKYVAQISERTGQNSN